MAIKQNRRSRARWVLFMSLVLFVGVLGSVAVVPGRAGAVTNTVTNCSGAASDAGSLPYEVANAASGDTVGFSVNCPASSPITLSGTIDVTTQDLTIQGPGAESVVVDGAGHTAFYVNGMRTTVSGLTVEDSKSAFYNDKNTGSLTVIDSTLSRNNDNTGDGGAINFLNGSATVDNSNVTGNTASDAGGAMAIHRNGQLNVLNSTISDNSAAVGGGGIGNSQGTVTISDSTVSGNSGGTGGGIDNEGGTLHVQNSTIADNQSDAAGAGGLYNAGTTTITNSTFAENFAYSDSDPNAMVGYGLYNETGTVSLAATILEDPAGPECASPSPTVGTIIDLGYNMATDGSCGLTAPTSRSNTYALLDSGFEHNGGPTQTIALQSISPAVNAVTSAPLCESPDQRGIARPTPCDIGAVQATVGAWTVDTSPNVGAYSELNAISCASSSFCKVVGTSNSGSSSSKTLIESWNGSHWTIDSSPNRGVGNNGLSGVSCPSSTSCTAVGYSTHGSDQRTLVESWNGQAWSIVSSPNGPSQNNELNAVSCTSATVCKAVGEEGTEFYRKSQAVIESWNGRRWLIEPSSNGSPASNGLNGVSCISATSCKAVGFGATTSSGTTLSLVESWNGTTWSHMASPAGALYSVSCVSTVWCIAGGSGYSHYSTSSIIDSWNGTSWQVMFSPDEMEYFAGSTSVSCTSTVFCIAVGYSIDAPDDSFYPDAFIEAWNGSKWSFEGSAGRLEPSTGNVLSGVSCATTRSCHAVGSSSDPDFSETLIEHRVSGSLGPA